MKNLLAILTTLSLLFANVATAADNFALPAISGYDVVSYFTKNEAVKGNGFNTSEHDGQTYIFSSKENKELFDKNPTKYLPEFGGWCAYGASLGKKFHVDPTIFEVVDGKLYLNLNSDIQKKWEAEKTKNIETAHTKWPNIKDKKASDL